MILIAEAWNPNMVLLVMNIIVIIFLIICIVVYFLKQKLAWAMNAGIQLMFFGGVIGVCLATFIPVVFTYAATESLKANGTLASIQNIDSSISFDKIVQPGTQLFDSVKQFLTGQQAQNQGHNTPKPKQGLLEQQVYPTIIASYANILQWTTFILSLIFIILSLYLSYTFAGMGDTLRLEKRIKALETLLGKETEAL